MVSSWKQLMLVAIAVVCYTANAMSGHLHGVDMKEVLGANPVNTEVQDRLNNLTAGFASLIDKGASRGGLIVDISDVRSFKAKDGLLKIIEDIAPDFSWGRFTHRMFFHWGFQTDPRRVEVLAEAVFEATKSYEDGSERRERIWNAILGEQSRRNRAMEALVRVASRRTGGQTILRDREINAIAAILYDTHILGDYIEAKSDVQREPLVAIDLIVSDINHAVRIVEKQSRGDLQDRSKLRSLCREFRHRIRRESRRSSNDADRAEKVLSYMKRALPAILYESPRIRKSFDILQNKNNPQK